jgi:hypothetical protein
LPPEFLAGALYTEAMVIMKAGNDERALIKAEALLDSYRFIVEQKQ